MLKKVEPVGVMTRWLHRLGWHSMFVIGWTVMGNPIEKCSLCDHYTYTLGSTYPLTMEIDEEQANNLMEGGSNE